MYEESIEAFLKDADRIIDSEMRCETPEYRTFDALRNALKKIWVEIQERGQQ